MCKRYFGSISSEIHNYEIIWRGDGELVQEEDWKDAGEATRDQTDDGELKVTRVQATKEYAGGIVTAAIVFGGGKEDWASTVRVTTNGQVLSTNEYYCRFLLIPDIKQRNIEIDSDNGSVISPSPHKESDIKSVEADSVSDFESGDEDNKQMVIAVPVKTIDINLQSVLEALGGFDAVPERGLTRLIAEYAVEYFVVSLESCESPGNIFQFRSCTKDFIQGVRDGMRMVDPDQHHVDVFYYFGSDGSQPIDGIVRIEFGGRVIEPTSVFEDWTTGGMRAKFSRN